jgi:exodeoxyribonuclease VII large subunit
VETINALDRMADIDVVLVARGGGSLEDLWPFNQEAVARAIFASRAPVVTGVGHETDVTIADMVADQRAPTPSAAAEMAVPDGIELAARLLQSQLAIRSSVSERLREAQVAVGHIGPRLLRNRPDLDGLHLRVDDVLRSVAQHLRHGIEVKSERAAGLSMRLAALSPLDTLRRGYAIVQTETGAVVVSDTSQVAPGDLVDVMVAKGGFNAEVRSTHAGNGTPTTSS